MGRGRLFYYLEDCLHARSILLLAGDSDKLPEMTNALNGNSKQQLRFSGDLSQCGKRSLCPELTSNTEAWK